MGFFDSITGGGLLSAGASIFSGILGAESASDTNAAMLNAQRELRDTQYQSAVKDMEKAGLNPMLATKLGGNLASAPPTLTPPASAGVQSALNSAQVVKTYADAEASKATAANQKANADVTEALGAIKVQSEIDNLRSSAHQSLSQADVNLKSLDMMNYQMDKIFSETTLNQQQQDLVRKQAANAVLTGQNIVANTGNTQMDTALKAAQRAYYEIQSKLGSQEINFNVLDLPRRVKESNMHESAYGSLVPYFNSAGKAVDTLVKGIQLMPK
jgi:peptidyl-tRNA hydrolase